MRTKKCISNRVTLTKDTFYKKRVPASFIKEVNFVDNLPQLLSLHCVLNESDLNDQSNQSFRDTYQGFNSFTSPVTKSAFSQTCRQLKRYIVHHLKIMAYNSVRARRLVCKPKVTTL